MLCILPYSFFFSFFFFFIQNVVDLTISPIKKNLIFMLAVMVA